MSEFLSEQMNFFDVIVIGGGCAGFPASVYAKRYNLSSLVICKEIGGLINNALSVENFPGFKSIPGYELGLRLKDQAEFNGVQIINASVVSVEIVDSFDSSLFSNSVKCVKDGVKVFSVKLNNDKVFYSYSLIFATGAKHRHLGLSNEKDFLGKGVSYCATCDNMFFKDKVVAVVGGGDSAFVDAGILAERCKKVYIFVRSEIRAEPVNVVHIKKFPNVEIVKGVVVSELMGEDNLSAVKLSNGRVVELDGLFIAIGLEPLSNLAVSIGVEVNDRGEIIVDFDCRTNVSGVFACGDVTNNGWKQAVVAAYQGSRAGLSAYKYLKSISK